MHTKKRLTRPIKLKPVTIIRGLIDVAPEPTWQTLELLDNAAALVRGPLRHTLPTTFLLETIIKQLTMMAFRDRGELVPCTHVTTYERRASGELPLPSEQRGVVEKCVTMEFSNDAFSHIRRSSFEIVANVCKKSPIRHAFLRIEDELNIEQFKGLGDYITLLDANPMVYGYFHESSDEVWTVDGMKMISADFEK